MRTSRLKTFSILMTTPAGHNEPGTPLAKKDYLKYSLVPGAGRV